MKRIAWLYIVTGLVFTRCERKPVLDTENKPTSNGVTLIFEHIPENSRYVFANGISTNNGDIEIEYLDDNLIPKYISPNPYVIDTFRITSHRRIIEVQHAYRGIDKLSVFLMNGDTAHFLYDEKRPQVIVTNRITNRNDTNYELIMRDIVCAGDFPATLKHQVPFAFIKRDSGSSEMAAKIYGDKTDEFKTKAF